MNKREALEELTLKQRILAKKAIRIMKYYSKPKQESTQWNRAIRAIALVSQIASIQAEKRVIIASPGFQQGGIIYKLQ